MHACRDSPFDTCMCWFNAPCLILTINLINQMLMHVTKNYIIENYVQIRIKRYSFCKHALTFCQLNIWSKFSTNYKGSEYIFCSHILFWGYTHILHPFPNISLFRDSNKWLHTEQNERIHTLKYIYIHPYVVVHLKCLKRLIFRNKGSRKYK